MVEEQSGTGADDDVSAQASTEHLATANPADTVAMRIADLMEKRRQNRRDIFQAAGTNSGLMTDKANELNFQLNRRDDMSKELGELSVWLRLLKESPREVRGG